MKQKKRGTVTLICGIISIVSAAIILVLRCVFHEAVVENNDLFYGVLCLVLGVYLCYKGIQMRKDA